MGTQLRIVDPTQDHPRELARRRIKEYRQPTQPIVNIHDRDVPAPTLDADEILRKSEGNLIGKT